MLQSEFIKQYPNYIRDGVTFTPEYTCSDITIVYNEQNEIIDYELVDFELIRTAEEVSQLKPTQPQQSKIEILEGKVTALEESQIVQDALIDDIVFEVIPSLETQIASSTTNPGEVATLLNKNIKKLKTNKKGRDGMAAYLAKKIIEGRDYRTVFKTNAYKQYQDEVDTILELEGRGDLIDRRL